jgi:hypothetical protein
MRLFCSGLIFWSLVAVAADQTTRFHYQLLADSTLVDDCPACGRPTIVHSLRGSFDLVLVQANPIQTEYRIENLQAVAGSDSNRIYRVTGTGTYQVRGEVAVFQDVQLEARINDQTASFTNAERTVSRQWPMLQVSLNQTNGTLTQLFYLTLVAAPVRELWFSIEQPLTNGPTIISPGDILSKHGRIVRTDQQLLGRIGLMPSIERQYPVDAFDVWPGGEMVFSLNEDVFSEKLGRLGHGDLLSHQGRVVRRNAELLSRFVLPKPPPDAGLDAVSSASPEEIWFSIHTDIAESSIGRLARGDLLSDRGVRIKTFKELMARFRPPDTAHDYGLDALYVWPAGEIWFSTEESFVDQSLGPISAGDLLSDSGSIVWRQRDLTGVWSGDTENPGAGLDGVFVVSDVYADRTPPVFQPVATVPAHPGIELRWQGSGKVFQLEKSAAVTGPYQNFGGLTADNRAEDPAAVSNAPPAFYRLRQW